MSSKFSITLSAEDIERLVLGPNPSEEARVIFANKVMAHYAEHHVKALANSAVMKDVAGRVDAALGAIVSAQLNEFGISESGYHKQITLSPKCVIAIQERTRAAVDATLRDARDSFENAIALKIEAVKQHVAKRLDALGADTQLETLIMDVMKDKLERAAANVAARLAKE